MFNLLSESQEQLLKEIIDHRDEKGNCDINYWVDRLDNISNAEDSIIRSIFSFLKNNNYIVVGWADDTVYHLELLDEGITYFQNKKAFLKEQKKLSRREWRIAIVAAITGALIGLIPTIIRVVLNITNTN